MNTGKDRGKKGKVLRALPVDNKLVVEGVNIRRKRQRPRRSNEKGQLVEMPLPIAASNVLLFCSSCGKGSRIRFTQDKGKKLRTCVRCGKEL